MTKQMKMCFYADVWCGWGCFVPACRYLHLQIGTQQPQPHPICSAIYPSIHAMESRRVSGQVADSFVRLQVSLLSGVLRATIPGACRT